MDYRSIVPELPRSSRLAFGCASIMGRVGKKQSIYALNQALDFGITHFDVARSYGYGEAEACVGKVLKPYREKVIIATKFGILPGKNSLIFKQIKPIIRKFIKNFPSSHKLLMKGVQITNIQAVPKKFTLKIARTSLEKSLTELKTDYIDLFFLHDCSPDDLTAELTDFLQALVKEGKIRAYGAATTIDDVNKIEKDEQQCILQFPNSLMYPCISSTLFNSAVITYSPFLGMKDIMTLISANKHKLQSSDLLLFQQKDIYELMLCYALNVNPNGIVISSMLNGDHLRNNVFMYERSRFTRAQIFDYCRQIMELI